MKNILPLKTERLIIRKTTIEDIYLLLKMDKQEVTQLYLGGLKNKTKEERIVFLKNKILKSKNDILGNLTICLLDKTPIGFIDIKIQEDIAELSYIFDFDYCKKGYCTEASKKIIDICLSKLNITKIYAKTKENNESSKKVLSKLGFKLKNNNKTKNNIFIEYEITKSDY